MQDKKKIHTTIDYNLWKQAAIKEVKWTEALEIGVKAMIGINTKKEELKAQLNEYRAHIQAIELKLKEINEIEQKAKEQQKLRVVKRFD